MRGFSMLCDGEVERLEFRRDHRRERVLNAPEEHFRARRHDTDAEVLPIRQDAHDGIARATSTENTPSTVEMSSIFPSTLSPPCISSHRVALP